MTVVNIFQTGSIAAIAIVYILGISIFCRNFTNDKRLVFLLNLPIFIFVIGYALRINGNKWQIDLGYFLTDSASIFLYSLFTGSLILGQMKFWKK